MLHVLVGDDQVDGLVALLLALELFNELVDFVGVHHPPGINVGGAFVDEEGAVVVDDDPVAGVAEPGGCRSAETHDVGGDVAALLEHVGDGESLHHVAAQGIHLKHHRLTLRNLGEVVFEQIAGITPAVYLTVEFDLVHDKRVGFLQKSQKIGEMPKTRTSSKWVENTVSCVKICSGNGLDAPTCR